MASHGSDIHFFKKIEEDALRNGELRIPRSFVSKCWKGISNPVVLLLPNGAEWQVGWKKVDADVWLINGWKKFAEFYCLDQDQLLVFTRVDKSKFKVVILEHNGLEMVYPLMKGTSNGKDQSISLIHRKRAKSPLPCSYSTKKTKRAQSQRTKVHTGDFGTVKPKKGRERIMNANTDRRCSRSKVIQSEDLLKDTQSSTALERANAFCSENPFFIRQMYPSHIEKYFLAIPGSFISEDQLKKVECITLYIREKTWDIKFYLNPSTAQIMLRLGWMDFVKDNDLKIGDACVFEQIKKPGISFRVTIYRDEEPNLSMATAKGSKQREHQNLIKRCSKSKVIQSEKHSALERAKAFGSDNPFCICEMKPSYIQRHVLAIPRLFITEHKLRKGGNITLWNSEDRTWPVKVSRNPSNGQNNLTIGWREFAEENNLKLGNVCVFEKIKSLECSFRVYIFRDDGEESSHSMIPACMNEANPSNEIRLGVMSKGGSDGISIKHKGKNIIDGSEIPKIEPEDV